jgi:hypothetical protein
LSIPISFSVWFDFTEKRTSPILNTDYRFALLELNYLHKLPNSKIKNIGFRFIPFFHESTHLGDELVIARINDTISTERARINVSYETFELSTIINDPCDQKIRNHALRIGAKFLWNSGKGYYTLDTLENLPGVNIKPSKRWIEPYLQYQFQNPDGWLSNKKMMFMFSQDFSLRVRYGYPFTYFEAGKFVTEELREAYQLCSNTFVGWKFLNAQNEISNTGIFLTLYLGINPHGQFRNFPVYPWLGINFIHDI